MYKVSYILFLMVAKALMLLNTKQRLRLFKTIAFFLYLLDWRNKKCIKTNLSICFAEVSPPPFYKEISKQSYLTLMQNALTVIEHFFLEEESIKERIGFKNPEKVEALLAKKERVVFVSAHYGNWEITGAGVSTLLTPCATTYKKLNNPYLDSLLRQSRERFNMHMVEKKGAVRGLMKALKQGMPIQTLVDQNTSDKDGYLVDFFGKKARQPATAAFLSRQLDAWIVMGHSSTKDGLYYEISFQEPFKCAKTENKEKDIQECTQKQSDIIEKIIKEEPKPWFWLHKRWKNQYAHLYKRS